LQIDAAAGRKNQPVFALNAAMPPRHPINFAVNAAQHYDDETRKT
jgi:hypothetical protein